jgi:phytanoyl-CoA hydroxylase
MRFTEAELARYDSDGYVLRERLFDAGEVRAITDGSERLVDEMAQVRRGRRSRAGSYVFEPNAELAVIIKWEGDSDIVHGLEPFAHLSPEMKQWALDDRFVGPMKDICGDEDPALFTEKLNLKRPHVGGRNPLHQDYPYWLDASDDPSRLATAMVFLDDSTLANGCLQVLPGSHRLGVQPMRTDSDEFGNNEMDPRPFADAHLVPLEVPAGSVVYFGSLLIHMSEMNTSDRERRALLFSYGPNDQRHMSDILAEEMSAARGA